MLQPAETRYTSRSPPDSGSVRTGLPVGAVVARGEAEIGFQQMSELLPVPGIDILGGLPKEIEQITTFSTGLHVNASAADAARELVAFFRAPAAHAVIRRKGMAVV